MTIERTKNYAVVHGLFGFTPIPHDSYIYLIAKDGMDPVACFPVVPSSVTCAEVHVCVRPEAYGERSREAARLAIEWMWANTSVTKLIGFVARSRQCAIKFTQDVGFKRFAVDRKSFFHDGKTEDRIMFEIFRPGVG